MHDDLPDGTQAGIAPEVPAVTPVPGDDDIAAGALRVVDVGIERVQRDRESGSVTALPPLLLLPETPAGHTQQENQQSAGGVPVARRNPSPPGQATQFICPPPSSGQARER